MPVARARKRNFYGKYRGVVVDALDPEARGRVRMTVPQVLGGVPSGWAEACLPPLAGLPVTAPAVGSAVWVEFEGGDVSRPIWSGRLWPNPGDAPATSSAITLGEAGGASLTISDHPGQGLTLKAASGAAIMISAAGISIDNGQGASIQLTGPTVSINRGALVVI